MQTKTNFGYNPATSGFPAKIWECMRRNLEFTGAVQTSKKYAARAVPAYAKLGHPCASIVGNCLARGGIVTGNPSRLKPFSEDHAWPQLPSEFQLRLTASISGEMPRELDLPGDIDGLIEHLPQSLRDYDLSDDELWASFVDWNLLGYKVIVVPEFIRDSAHRKAVLKKIDKIVPRASRDPRPFEATGRVLGSKADWDAYLVTQHYFAAGYPITQAKWMAAWYCFEREDFEEWAPASGTELKGAARAQARAIYAKKGTHIDDRVANIRRAIEQVYPVFRPYS